MQWCTSNKHTMCRNFKSFVYQYKSGYKYPSLYLFVNNNESDVNSYNHKVSLISLVGDEIHANGNFPSERSFFDIKWSNSNQTAFLCFRTLSLFGSQWNVQTGFGTNAKAISHLPFLLFEKGTCCVIATKIRTKLKCECLTRHGWSQNDGNTEKIEESETPRQTGLTWFTSLHIEKPCWIAAAHASTKFA